MSSKLRSAATETLSGSALDGDKVVIRADTKFNAVISTRVFNKKERRFNCWPLGPFTEFQALLCYTLLAVVIALTDDHIPMPKSHFEEFLAGNREHFGGELLEWFSVFGQLFLSWWLGMVTMAWMMPLYMIWHRLSPKFHTYKPLARNWRLHVASGCACAILCFVGFFLRRPQPLMRMTAAFDLLHFATTMYQMRMMMFGDRDIIYPEYLWLMLVKLALAVCLFATPSDPRMALRYGVTLSAFSYQRLFIAAFRAIYQKNEHYVLATTLCGVMGGYQAIGCLWASLTLFPIMGIYTFLMKGHRFVGGDMTVGQDTDRALNIFKQRSMRFVTQELHKMFPDVTGSQASEKERLELALTITSVMSSQKDAPTEKHQGRIDGLVNILLRLGFGDLEVERLIKSYGLDLADASNSFSISDVEANKELHSFLLMLYEEYKYEIEDQGGISHDESIPVTEKSISNLLITMQKRLDESTQPEWRFLSLDEISRHHTASAPWVLIAGEVYDLTDFIHRHPGGPAVLLQLAGTDATEKFRAKHGDSQKVASVLAKIHIGSARLRPEGVDDVLARILDESRPAKEEVDTHEGVDIPGRPQQGECLSEVSVE